MTPNHDQTEARAGSKPAAVKRSPRVPAARRSTPTNRRFGGQSSPKASNRPRFHACVAGWSTSNRTSPASSSGRRQANEFSPTPRSTYWSTPLPTACNLLLHKPRTLTHKQAHHVRARVRGVGRQELRDLGCRAAGERKREAVLEDRIAIHQGVGGAELRGHDRGPARAFHGPILHGGVAVANLIPVLRCPSRANVRTRDAAPAADSRPPSSVAASGRSFGWGFFGQWL